MAKLFGYTIEVQAKAKQVELEPTPVESSIIDGAIETYVPVVLGTGLPGSAMTRHDISIADLLAGRSDIAWIEKYREMAGYPKVDVAIDHIVNEAVIVDNPNEQTVKINTDELLNNGVDKSIVKDITDEFENILIALDFKNKAYDIFRQFYIDGRLFYHVIPEKDKPENGIAEIRMIDPRKILKVRIKMIDTEDGIEVEKGEVIKYLYNVDGISDVQLGNINNGIYNGSRGDVYLSDDSIVYVHSGKTSPDNTQIRSNLHPAVKFYNNLRHMEDALVMYRVHRGIERRIFNVEVGGLTTYQAEEYLQQQIAQYSSSQLYDPETGEIHADRKFLSLLKDYWFAMRDGSGTEIDTLSEGENLSEIDDVKYFVRELFRALKVPFSRIDLEVDGGGERLAPDSGADIEQHEILFSRFVSRIRHQFSGLFDQLLVRQLLLKNIIATEDEWDDMKRYIHYEFARDNHFREQNNLAVLNMRADAASNMEDFVDKKYISHGWLIRNVLRLDQQEIDEMRKEIEQEQEQDLYEHNVKRNTNISGNRKRKTLT